MARSTWSGSISFGLVSIPVRVFTAEREHEVHFHQLNAKTGHRIRHKKVDATTGREVDADQIVRAVQVNRPGRRNGSWVTVDEEAMARLRPASTRTVDIEDFVDLAEIDPIYFDRTYFLAPGADVGARRAYALLLDAMTRSGRAGIGKVVIRNKQYLAAIRPYGTSRRRRVMAMSTMRFADEVVDPGDVDDLSFELPSADDKARSMAASLIESLAGPFEPSKYRDTYTDEVHELIERSAAGDDVEVEERPEPTDAAMDLMAALQQSVDAAKKRRSSRPTAPRQRKRPTSSTRSAEKQPTKQAKKRATGRPKKPRPA